MLHDMKIKLWTVDDLNAFLILDKDQNNIL